MYIINGVNDTFEITRGELIKGDSERGAKIVFIGTKLIEEELRKSVEGCKI